MQPSVHNPLTGSTSNVMILALCAGLAEWLGCDSTLVRVLYAVLTVCLVAFLGVIIYLILWFVMPQN